MDGLSRLNDDDRTTQSIHHNHNPKQAISILNTCKSAQDLVLLLLKWCVDLSPFSITHTKAERRFVWVPI